MSKIDIKESRRFEIIDNKDNELFKPSEQATEKSISELVKIFSIIKKSLERASDISQQFKETADRAKIIELNEMLDYAMEDLKEYAKCETCRFLKKGNPDFCLADGCADGDCWEWRGKSGRE